MFRYLIFTEFDGGRFKHFHVSESWNQSSSSEYLQNSESADTKEGNT